MPNTIDSLNVTNTPVLTPLNLWESKIRAGQNVRANQHANEETVTPQLPDYETGKAAVIAKERESLSKLAKETDTTAVPLEVAPKTVKKDVGIAVYLGQQHQQLFDIYMSNSGSSDDNSNKGISLNTLQSSQKTLAEKAIANYQEQAEAASPPNEEIEHKPEALT